jgi:hypothetical protein
VELIRCRLVAQPAPDDLDPVRGIRVSRHLDGDAEAVEELRAELSLLGVHGADQDKARGVTNAYALALDVVHAHRGDVEEQVYEMVREQVDLVNVQDAPVRRREQPGLESLPPLGERLLDVQRPGQAVRAGPDG